jgi:putative Ca2+/H+ antiporter (TMEM165/GDT1 family)
MVTAFVTIFLAELPDKTMLATIVLSARFRRPFAVWLGAAAALTTQMVIATTAGRLLGLLPDRPVKIAVAVLFAVGAVLLWRSSDDSIADDAALDGTDTADVASNRQLPWKKVSATVFGIVFVAEWGDLTQLATASLAAKGHALSVFVGATLAMLTVAAIGVVAGRALLRVVPERVLHKVAAVVFAALAVYFLFVAFTEADVSGGLDLAWAAAGSVT